MKHLKRNTLLLGAGILGASAVLSFGQPAQADPPPHARNERNGKFDSRKDRGRNDHKRGNQKRNDHRRNDHKRGNRRNDSWNKGTKTGFSGFAGTVIRVKSAQSFDVSIGGKTYNVYTDSRLPRGLSNRDIVRVSGNRVGSNDIRNARVVIVSNR